MFIMHTISTESGTLNALKAVNIITTISTAVSNIQLLVKNRNIMFK